MEMSFYYLLGREKGRFLVDNHLDSKEFDFLQNFASDIDELQLHGTNHAELCLRVINASCSNLWHGGFG